MKSLAANVEDWLLSLGLGELHWLVPRSSADVVDTAGAEGEESADWVSAEVVNTLLGLTTEIK